VPSERFTSYLNCSFCPKKDQSLCKERQKSASRRVFSGIYDVTINTKHNNPLILNINKFNVAPGIKYANHVYTSKRKNDMVFFVSISPLSQNKVNPHEE
jgi:hypothetical protein